VPFVPVPAAGALRRREAFAEQRRHDRQAAGGVVGLYAAAPRAPTGTSQGLLSSGMATGLAPILREADNYLLGASKLHQAASDLANLLEQACVPYAVCGALALALHGRVRLTTVVDILIRQDDLSAFKRRWLGRSYVEVTPGLKAIRDITNDVRIDFLLAGDYPGDGKQKPVYFPDPQTIEAVGDRFRVLPLATLVELKQSSGMTAPTAAKTSWTSSSSSAPTTSTATTPCP
jgi:hypothetical protein